MALRTKKTPRALETAPDPMPEVPPEASRETPQKRKRGAAAAAAAAAAAPPRPRRRGTRGGNRGRGKRGVPAGEAVPPSGGAKAPSEAPKGTQVRVATRGRLKSQKIPRELYELTESRRRDRQTSDGLVPLEGDVLRAQFVARAGESAWKNALRAESRMWPLCCVSMGSAGEGVDPLSCVPSWLPRDAFAREIVQVWCKRHYLDYPRLGLDKRGIHLWMELYDFFPWCLPPIISRDLPSLVYSWEQQLREGRWMMPLTEVERRQLDAHGVIPGTPPGGAGPLRVLTDVPGSSEEESESEEESSDEEVEEVPGGRGEAPEGDDSEEEDSEEEEEEDEDFLVVDQ